MHLLCKEIYCICRVHGNTHRIPHNSLTAEDVRNIVLYLRHYAEDNAILLPGRIPGYKNCNMQLLPSSTTKSGVWSKYQVKITKI